jgi:hypothetical protein
MYPPITRIGDDSLGLVISALDIRRAKGVW